MFLSETWWCDGCWEQERIALLQLKPFFGSPLALQNWVDAEDNSDCCQRERVKCNNTTGRVSQLSLNDTSAYWISGKWYLNASLFLPFEELTSLSLKGNSILGCVENEGFERLSTRLSNLEVLDLSFNSFNESTLPSLNVFSSLKSLNLGYNQFTAPIQVQDLPNLENLEELYLDQISLNNSFLRMVRVITSLKVLSLSSCGLTGSLPNAQGAIPLEFCQLLYLEVLDLANNNVSGILPSCFRPSSIIHVHLSDNRIEGPMTSALSDSRFLVTLDLSNNHITGRIPKWIGGLPALRFLLLKNNNFDGEIPLQMCEFYSLSLIDLSNNNLSGPIPSCFAIDHPDVSSPPKISSSCLCLLLPLDQSCLLLPSFNVYNKAFFLLLPGKNSLICLGLISCNKLVGEIPPQIGNLSKIHTLNLSHNRFTGPIPETFSNLKQIESLDFSYNKLSGQIPSQLTQLNYLSVFSVAHNNLSGKTPERTEQFSTFEASSYEGNLYLCGLPLPKSCTSTESSSLPRASATEEESGFLDMNIFYATCLSYSGLLKPYRNLVADWVSNNDVTVRSFSIFIGGASLLAVLFNRAASGIALVASASRVLEINPRHPIIKELRERVVKDPENYVSGFAILAELKSDLSIMYKVKQKDAATWLVLWSHLQLQKDGFLSTWTNSFVGPWDPSQGLHNPDEKIKLWLFLPGRHSSVVEKAQAAVSRLRVVASGIWVAPGDNEEVAAALSQSLRNCIEKALVGLSYMRFGDVFSKYNPSQSEGLFRRQPTVEFIFAATEEAIFVHVRISAKHIRPLSTSDIERVLKCSANNSGYRLPVIVSPHGMRGWLTGCCPNDLVKQVYFSSSGKFRTSNGFIGLPNHFSQGPGCLLRGQNCYVEVTLGCPRSESEKGLRSNSNLIRNLPKNHVVESPAIGRGVIRDLQFKHLFWLQNWIGPSLPGSSFVMHCGGDIDNMEGSWIESNGIRIQRGYNSSSNSNSSSIGSISSSSSDSDRRMTTEAGDLEADADSLSCRQSGLSSNDQLENDGPNCCSTFQLLVGMFCYASFTYWGSKRPHSGVTESYGQMGIVKNSSMQDVYKSDFGSFEVGNSAITGVANEQIGSQLDWDDDDRGMGINIQALLSEFGDFDDFFENDALPFGEVILFYYDDMYAQIFLAPWNSRVAALMFSAPDCGEVVSSPIGVMDVADHMLLPVGFPSFESFNPPPTAVIDECVSKNQEIALDALTSVPVNHTPPSSAGEFDHLIKAEALMSFAPEYGAVETCASEFFPSIFRSPYCPKSRKVESSNSSTNNYTYSATPPSSPCLDGSDEKTGMPVNAKAGVRMDIKKYYTHVETGKVQCNRISVTQMRDWYHLHSLQSILQMPSNLSRGKWPKPQVRHVLLSSCNPAPQSLSRLSSGTVLSELPGDGSTMTDNISSRYEVKKKESIPVRIAGDIDGVLDGHHNAPVGVWRSVAVPKVTKPSSSPSIEVSPSLPHHSLNEERMLSYKNRQPLQELLDGMALLVQQATSFVDVALDADCGDGPYGWLALQEHWRRGFSCGPSMVHAGCGGTLASCHSLDIAGMQLVDPLSSDIHASSVISLLQSEIKTALKSAFENLDGPLSVTDWCRGRSQSGVGTTCDGSLADSTLSECKDSSSTVCLSVGEPMSPAQSSAGASSCLKVDGAKADDTGQRRLSQEIESEQLSCSRRPSLFVLPSPAILVGYQDDWLKTSASSLQLWEKAPFEPYASPKPISYCVICPDIDPLTSAAADFFQQLGTVYEICKLGTHQPQSLGNQMEIDSGKLSTSGFVMLDCPQSMKIESSNTSLVGSISDYFLSLSNGWDLTSYLKSLSKAVKSLKIGPCISTSTKEGNSGPCMVIYVVCPFPEPIAVLQTIIESSVAVGSTVLPSDRERRPLLLSQVGKALSCSAVVDEASPSNVLVLSGFNVPKLVLQIVTVDAIFRVTSPALNELVILKETAFTVYNKARRISKGSSYDVQSSTLSNRSHPVMQQMTSIPAIWKDCVGPRLGGPSLPREGEIDAGLRPGTWDNSWQTRSGGLNCDPSRNGDLFHQDEIHYMFEPLFILSEPGSLEHAAAPGVFGNLTAESSKLLSDDSGGGFMQSGSSAASSDTGSSSQLDGLEPDGVGGTYQKTLPSLHCCYGWTEDWRWLVCIWTDARGELLDSHIFPFGGISSRQDTKGLQCLFVQVLQQGCQILQACFSHDIGSAKPRDFVITRIGNFFELECLEWQKAIYSVGGSEVKKWPLQLRRSMPDGMSAGSNGATLQQQEMSLMQERTLPSSPSPMYSPHSKGSGFMKGGLGQSSARKQLIGGHTVVDSSRGMLQWVQSISFVAISIDHSLHLVFQADSPSPGGTQSGNGVGASGYLEGFTPVKSLWFFFCVLHFNSITQHALPPPTPLQLPTCLTAESPPLAHLLHSKGSAIPLSTGFVVSKAVPSMRKDYRSNSREEWPSILSVSLIDYYGGNNVIQEKISRGVMKQGGRPLGSEVRDLEIEIHLILESIAAELHALSWMTVSPAYLERRTALPFHCDMVLRLRRLLHFADKELSSQPDKSQM
ncbi:hypothetical protein GH714_014053 [Hevea brasiliensis]|uniref:Mediator of RNA polymerase II transcription subunit 13 n=1 Tax=Hevea brasiliensis TaxID=3981 RepID=A0A6A6MDT7_HEVBR|nr:hypothetical protein GH714_014053 [Hevea brasiliensis]